jgi:hypothetical protein
MFIDHKNPEKHVVDNGWIDDTILRVVNDSLDENMVISDKEYIKALEVMIFWLNFHTGINTSIGYEDTTRHNN